MEFWYRFEDKSNEQIKDELKRIEDETYYMIDYPDLITNGIKGLIQTKDKMSNALKRDLKIEVRFISKSDMKTKIGEIHRREKIFKERGTYYENRRHIKPHIDPNYFE